MSGSLAPTTHLVHAQVIGKASELDKINNRAFAIEIAKEAWSQTKLSGSCTKEHSGLTTKAHASFRIFQHWS